MNKEIKEDLENPENWDFEHPEVREPVKTSRVVVSVAFKRDDFTLVSEYAERLGKKISEFIREAAIEKTIGRDQSMPVIVSGSMGGVFGIEQLPTYTVVFATSSSHLDKTPASTY